MDDCLSNWIYTFYKSSCAKSILSFAARCMFSLIQQGVWSYLANQSIWIILGAWHLLKRFVKHEQGFVVCMVCLTFSACSEHSEDVVDWVFWLCIIYANIFQHQNFNLLQLKNKIVTFCFVASMSWILQYETAIPRLILKPWWPNIKLWMGVSQRQVLKSASTTSK
jgi:hypothetical protein